MAGAATAVALLTGALVAMPATAAVPGDAAVRAAGPLVGATRMASFDSEMLSLVNSARANAGVPRLSYAGGLTSLAVWWSNQMATGATGYQLEHNPNAWTMVTQYGASNRTAWAENVAAFPTAASAQAVFQAYMNSPGHRANILSSRYHYVGIGTVAGSKGAFDTMEFTDKVDGAPAPKPSTSTHKPAPSTHKPAPTTHKPAPSTHQPAPTTHSAAPSTHHATPTTAPAPSTHSAAPRTSQSAPSARFEDSGQGLHQVQQAKQAAHGALVASFGALPLGGMTFAIRAADCRRPVTKATTGRDGRASFSVTPGRYCAVPVAAPNHVRLPKSTTFTATAGRQVTVTWTKLTMAPVWWHQRGGGVMCPV